MARTALVAIAGQLCEGYVVAIAGQLCEGHVALRHTQRFKTKTSSAPVPGLLPVQ